MRITLSDGVPEAWMAILGPGRRTRDGETEGTDLLAVPRRRGEVRACRCSLPARPELSADRSSHGCSRPATRW
jgi:hypothetical protein